MAPIATMDTYSCTSCNKVFGRLAHRKRHEQNHKDREFRCDKCSKAFHRKDVPNRHEQTHLVNKPSLLQQGARACSACAVVKSCCSGNIPCARCHAKVLQCVYPVSRSQSATINAAYSPAPDANNSYPADTEVLLQPSSPTQYRTFQDLPGEHASTSAFDWSSNMD